MRKRGMPNILLILSYIAKAAGFVATLNAIPFVSPVHGRHHFLRRLAPEGHGRPHRRLPRQRQVGLAFLTTRLPAARPPVRGLSSSLTHPNLPMPRPDPDPSPTTEENCGRRAGNSATGNSRTPFPTDTSPSASPRGGLFCADERAIDGYTGPLGRGFYQKLPLYDHIRIS